MAARKPTKADLDYFAGALRHMLQVLSGDIQKLESDALASAAHVAMASAEDSGGDAYAQEFSLELLEKDENTVRAVIEALDRVKEGTFGRCGGCEKWITKERLKAVPHARNCIECQRAEEQGQF